MIDTILPPRTVRNKLAGTANWTELKLTQNGEQLLLRQERGAGTVRTLAPWSRSGPGRYRLVLRGPDLREEWVVTVRPTKISPSEYRTLLDDLEARLPVQVAIALKEAEGLAGIELSRQDGSTLEQELVRLRRAVRGTGERLGLADLLKQMARDPHRVLETDEQWVRSERARRPKASGLHQAFSRPGNLDDGRPKKVPDIRSRHTTDVYENRVVREFADQVRRRLRRVEQICRDSRREDTAEEAARLQEAVRAARHEASFLDGVSRLTRPPSRATQVLQKRPLYRMAFQGYLDLQRGIGVTLETPALEAPLDNLPEIGRAHV